MIKLKSFLIALSLIFASTSSWSGTGKASVSYLEGSAFKSRNGREWKPLYKGDSLTAGEKIKTGAKSRLELSLPDGSIVRFSENTSFKVEAFLFKEMESSFSIRIFFGRIWSKVPKVKKVSSFEVKTANAVAGVRGTTYRMDVSQDSSSLVRVYEGEVAVESLPLESTVPGRRPKYIPGPMEVPGPHEVTREEWSYIVKSWQQITISAKGSASKPVSFDEKKDMDAWVSWNREMDKK